MVKRFNSILRGLMNFYNLAENRSDALNEMIYIIKYSLAHTLAAKHRLSLLETFKCYGNNLMIKTEKRIISLDAPTSLSASYLDKRYTKTKRYPSRSIDLYDPFKTSNYSLTQTILDQPCLICANTENIEVHHVNHLKNAKDKGNIARLMAELNRKVVLLCMSCHDKVHAGKYDGVSLKELLILQETNKIKQ